MNELLHIYGQDYNHSPVFIIGTKADLLKLKLAIEKSFYCPWQEEFFTDDGEGYYVNIIPLEDNKWEGKQIPLPYSHEPTMEFCNKGRWDLYSLWKSVRKWFGCKP